MLKPLIIIVGPTAVGKSELGVSLAKIFNSEVISGDSMQVYRGMDIGTAKIKKEEMQNIPHHMIDILEPNQEFSVAVFKEKVEKIINNIHKKGLVPIIVGGTGLYIRSIIDPYNFTTVNNDPKYREELNEILLELGKSHLHQMLEQVDPVSAKRLHINDTRRIIRALEVYHHTNKPISEFQIVHSDTDDPKFQLFYFGLNMSRDKLYERINLRVDKMISEGLIDEVRALLNQGIPREAISMQGLGYKEIIAYTKGECSLDDAIYLLKRNTRHFAKRQLTWFRRDDRIQWFNVENYRSMTEIANEIKDIMKDNSFQRRIKK